MLKKPVSNRNWLATIGLALTIVVMLFANLSALAHAGGGDILVSAAADGSGGAIAYNIDDDEYLAVWDGSSGSIYGQIYSAQGVPQGENFEIPGGIGEEAPAVVYNPTQHQYLVVWADRLPFYHFVIRGQLLDANGSPVGDNIVISNVSADQRDPAVAYNSTSDDYLVVWADERNSSADIYGQQVDANGTLLGTTADVNRRITDYVDDELYPDLAYNATDDEYQVVYERWTLGEADVYAQAVDATGKPGGTAWHLGANSEDQMHPSVAWDNHRNEYFFVWEEYLDCNSTGADIYVQRRGADNSQNQGAIALTQAPGDQTWPAVSFDPIAHQYLVVWQDGRDEITYATDIYGQRVLAGDEFLNLAGQGNIVICQAPYEQDTPAVAYSETSHQFLAVWQDGRDGQWDHLYGQRVWWLGLLLGNELAIAAPANPQEMPAVAYNSDDHEYLAVWVDERLDVAHIFGQRFSHEGLPLGGFQQIVWSTTDKTHPSVAYNSHDHEYLVVWANQHHNIYGQRLSAQGSAIGDAFLLFNQTGVRGEPVVAYNSTDNEYLVVYTKGGANEDDLCGALVAADGGLLWSDVSISGGASDQFHADVAYDATHNEYLIVWETEEDDDGDIYGRYMQANGEMPSTRVVVSVQADEQGEPAVTYNAEDDEFLIVWHDYRNSGATGSDIYAQRLRGGGGSSGGNFAVSTSGALDFQKYPDVVYDDAYNRYRVVWQDDRESATLGWDLRGQWVATDGTVLGVFDDPILRYPEDQEYPAIAFGPVSNTALTVWQDGRNGVAADVYGSFGALDVTPPVAHFTRDPVFGQAGDTFAFNAWPSSDDLTPKGLLMVRWDLDTNGTWDVDWGFTKYVTRTVHGAGVYTVTLEVRDTALFTDTLSRQVVVWPAARTQSPLAIAPTATLTVTPAFGAAGDTFDFDGTASTGSGQLQARWDWENDGEFDTAFDTTLTASHIYTVAGEYTARLEVQDGTGLSHAALHNVTVVPGVPVALEVLPADVKVMPHDAIRFRANAWDVYDNQMHHPKVAWSVTDPAAGVISATGVLSAGQQAGTYPDVVLAAGSGMQDTASVTIFYPYQTYLPLVMRTSQ
jgi:hypothetical protein